MKRLLVAAMAAGLASHAFAADAPAAKPALKAPAPAGFNWTSCYVGVQGGGAWGKSEHVARAGNVSGPTITGMFDLSGTVAGGAVGCDFQIEKTVLGFENDASWTNKHGSAPDQPPFNVAATSSTREKWIDMFRGRIGYALDQFLIYGTAGVAFAGTDVTVSDPAGAVTESRTRTGLAAGLGAEWAAWTDTWGAVSFKLEYVHTDFGSKRYFEARPPLGAALVATRDVRLTDDIVRAGVNVRFNWDSPVVTKN
ncbi:outer membrane protein [Bradyrhizobium sp. Cp5.3]|uniref:outer membrane protein n=1 Tax=Bradyrhizobium sp. Cp5.3 TaxID=443598 RepID=UPI0004837DB6|nr:outer membrane protein [Bradyrhizobium sp. Cp5.3]